jgi:predicted ATPase
MAAAGWTTIDDPGRAEFEAQLQAGFGPESVREKYLEFQRLVLKRILKNISALPDNEQAFFDYGIAESLAFMKVAGIPWDDEIVKAAATLHFKQIFLLDLVPLPRSTKDLIRNESDTSRKRLRDLILELYQALGQDPIIIPPISVEERFEMVSRILRAERH